MYGSLFRICFTVFLIAAAMYFVMIGVAIHHGWYPGTDAGNALCPILVRELLFLIPFGVASIIFSNLRGNQ